MQSINPPRWYVGSAAFQSDGSVHTYHEENAMSEKESTTFGKGEVRKDNPPKDRRDTTKKLGSTAIGGATK